MECKNGWLTLEQIIAYFEPDNYFFLESIVDIDKIQKIQEVFNIHKDKLIDMYVVFLGDNASYLIAFVEFCSNLGYKLNYTQTLTLLDLLSK